MTKEERLERLITVLKRINEDQYDEIGSQEGQHYEADSALVEYIDDPEVTKLYNSIEKWYS